MVESVREMDISMDESVLAAMAKWPNVPAASDWLSLDERGHWRLRGEPITHSGLIGFINRNYEPDEQGRWFFQNGPQRVYVSLAYTPLVLHVDADARLRAHTGETVSDITAACLDEQGNLLLETQRGVGLVASDALPRVSEWLVGAGGAPLAEEALEDPGASAGTDTGAALSWSGRPVPIASVRRSEVPERFGFIPDPQPSQAP